MSGIARRQLTRAMFRELRAQYPPFWYLQQGSRNDLWLGRIVSAPAYREQQFSRLARLAKRGRKPRQISAACSPSMVRKYRDLRRDVSPGLQNVLQTDLINVSWQ